MSRVFLSHSSADNAEALPDWMVAKDWTDLFLDLYPDRGIVAGERWEQALIEAARCCEAVLFIRGDLGSSRRRVMVTPLVTARLFDASDPEPQMSQLDRITQKPDVMGGKPCIRGLRVTVGMIVGQIAAGRSVEQVLAAFPYLEREDILQALRYAAWRSEEREVALVGS